MPWLKQRDVRPGVIGATQLADGSVTTDKLGSLAVTQAKIANSAVGFNQLAGGAVGLSKLQTQVAVESKVTLTNAEFLNLRATPKTIVAAQGSNTLIVVEQVILDITPSGGAYTETADNLQLKYENGSGAACSGVIETTGVIDGTARQISLAYGTEAAAIATTGLNKAVVLHNTGDGEFGGGNAANLITVTVRYHTVTLT